MDATNLPPLIEASFRTLAELLTEPEPSLAAIQAQVEAHLCPLGEQEWPEPLASRLRALLTEIQRELRLIQVEVLYLQTGRLPKGQWQGQSPKGQWPSPSQAGGHSLSPQQAQRRQQIDARFERLRQYCRAVLEPDQPVG